MLWCYTYAVNCGYCTRTRIRTRGGGTRTRTRTRRGGTRTRTCTRRYCTRNIPGIKLRIVGNNRSSFKSPFRLLGLVMSREVGLLVVVVVVDIVGAGEVSS